MKSLEFLQSSEILRFLGNSDLAELLLHGNTIQSRPNTHIEINSLNDEVVSSFDELQF